MNNEPESFSNNVEAVEEWQKYSFIVDRFRFFESVQSKSTGQFQIVERTASRIIKRNLETGELSYVCIDPACTHEPLSGCPLTSEHGFTLGKTIFGDWLYYLTNEDDEGRHYCFYNLRTGEIRDFGEQEGYSDSISMASFGNQLFVVMPELEGGSTVYWLRSYSIDSNKWKNICRFEKGYLIRAVSNKRVYMYEYGLDVAYSEAASFSVDYHGKHRREEPGMKMALSFKDGTVCYGAAYRDYYINDSLTSSLFAGYYLKYDVKTRIQTRIPETEGASALGLWKGKLVYATCKDLEIGVGINSYEYARENGLDASDPEVSNAVNEIRNRVFFGDRMYIKVCDTDGTNSETLFEYPGIFIDNGWVDGDYMTVKYSFLDPETGRQAQKTQRIDLNTGEFEDVPVYTLGDSDKVYTRPKQ
ncbi:MAG: hypothetical protein J6V48_01510 [Clostridia bacterium]|nr:hypothetical protein [Clostridia bacterium]